MFASVFAWVLLQHGVGTRPEEKYGMQLELGLVDRAGVGNALATRIAELIQSNLREDLKSKVHVSARHYPGDMSDLPQETALDAIEQASGLLNEGTKKDSMKKLVKLFNDDKSFTEITDFYNSNHVEAHLLFQADILGVPCALMKVNVVPTKFELKYMIGNSHEDCIGVPSGLVCALAKAVAIGHAENPELWRHTVLQLEAENKVLAKKVYVDKIGCQCEDPATGLPQCTCDQTCKS